MKKYRLAVAAVVASMLFTTVLLFASDTDNRIELFASDTDGRIETSAKNTYVFKTFLKVDDIKIKSKDGLVTLTGTVQEASHKSLAGETVAGLPGVKGVDNKLEEKGDRPAEKSDAWLISKVKTTLLFHRNVSATETEVLADKGTITLRGVAPSLAQKDLTTEYAKDVEGVENVNNEMTLSDAGAATSGVQKVTDEVNTVVESIDDASITALVKTSLLYHRSTSAINTKVETKNGVVTLGGIAKTSAEKDLAGRYASDVNGVNKVNNNMIVE
ncbi:MAG: BON domain-containing protein [Desulfobacula sp.]|jgi:hyperosmotically inducible protein|nr:BON domain-containing protein [Desulfobacula sp.]